MRTYTNLKNKLIEQHRSDFSKTTLAERKAVGDFLEHFADGLIIENVDYLRKERILN